MYAIKNEDDDGEFQQIGALIKKIRPEDTMRFLGIREKFIFERSNAVSYRPFSKAIKELEKIQ